MSLKMLPHSAQHSKQTVQKSFQKPVQKSTCVKKSNTVCNVVYTSLKACVPGLWYFDSGCSRHMTGEESYLTDYKAYDGGNVTYGGGSKGKIIGIGTLNVPGFPNLTKVLHVKGLLANLISISQLCDDDLHVKFDKSSCYVLNNDDNCLMVGNRSVDNCYLIDSNQACFNVQTDESILWHQKLGHAHYRNIVKLLKFDAVKGLPMLQIRMSNVCGSCQSGKQVKMSHEMLTHCTTKHCFELLHMDLMGPMETESIGGKRYSFVIVDDYSRYTWIEFLKEKSDAF